MAEALRAGKVDAVTAYPPNSTEIESAGIARPIFTSSRIPGEIVDVLALDEAVIRERPDDVAGVIRAFYRAVRYAQEHPEEAWRIMSERERVTPRRVSRSAAVRHHAGAARRSATLSRREFEPAGRRRARLAAAEGARAALQRARRARPAERRILPRWRSSHERARLSSAALESDAAAAGARHPRGGCDRRRGVLQHRGAAHAPAALPRGADHRHGQRRQRKPRRDEGAAARRARGERVARYLADHRRRSEPAHHRREPLEPDRPAGGPRSERRITRRIWTA